VPQHLIMGPWFHCEWYGTDTASVPREHLRWYDQWLKGIWLRGADCHTASQSRASIVDLDADRPASLASVARRVL
jgi:hypothetical protein